MKVLIFTNHFFPENFKVNDIAFELCAKGYRVTVVTGIPNYPKGKIYPGYGYFKKRNEILNGVQVVRLPLIPRGNAKSVRLIINYLSYLISSSIYSVYLSFTRKFDIIFVHETSPVTIGIPAVIYKFFRGTPIYFWVLDLWPESVQAASNIKNKFVQKSIEKLVAFIYNRCDKILISSKGFLKSILLKGNLSDRIVYFPNWAEDIFFDKTYLTPKHTNALQIEFPKGFIVMYAGNIGEAQDFENILKAILLLRSHSIHWMFIGGGRKEKMVIEFIEQNDLKETVLLPGNYPNELMPYFFSHAGCLLVSLKNEPIFSLTVPAKLQSYIAFGKPIVGVINGEGAVIIEQAQCGIVVPNDNPKALADAIVHLASLPENDRQVLGKNGSIYYHKMFGKSKNISVLENLFKSAGDD